MYRDRQQDRTPENDLIRPLIERARIEKIARSKQPPKIRMTEFTWSGFPTG